MCFPHVNDSVAEHSYCKRRMDDDIGKEIIPEKKKSTQSIQENITSSDSDGSNQAQSSNEVADGKPVQKRIRKPTKKKQLLIEANELSVVKAVKKKNKIPTQLTANKDEISITKVVQNATQLSTDTDELSVVKVVKKKHSKKSTTSPSVDNEVTVTKVVKKTKTRNITEQTPSPPRSPSENVSFDHSYCSSPNEDDSPDGKKKKSPKVKRHSKNKPVNVEKKPAKSTKSKVKKTTSSTTDESSTFKQSSITEHFQSKRSGRMRPSYLKKQLELNIETKIINGDEEGLEVREIEGKGRGVFVSRKFSRGELVCEYYGELLDYTTAKEREQKYSLTPEVGCYMYFFDFKGKKYCVDATAECILRLGRLLNHSKTKSNVSTRIFPIKDVPHLILVAARDIDVGEELLYDYGDRNKESIESHPWLLS